MPLSCDGFLRAGAAGGMGRTPASVRGAAAGRRATWVDHFQLLTAMKTNNQVVTSVINQHHMSVQPIPAPIISCSACTEAPRACATSSNRYGYG